MQSIIFRWEVFSLAVLLYIGLFLRHPNFSTCLASKESQSKNSVCLEDLKKRAWAGKQGMFAGCDFAKLEWCFTLFKSWPTYFAVKSNTQQQTFNQSLVHTEKDREGDFTIFSQTTTQYFLGLVILLLHFCLVLYKAERQRDKEVTRGAEVGAPSSWTLNWHWNKLKSKQNCPCLYKQLDCTLREDKGMKLCPYKVTLIFYLSNKKKHRREVRGRWRKNTQVLRPEKWKTKFGKDRNTCRWST